MKVIKYNRCVLLWERATINNNSPLFINIGFLQQLQFWLYINGEIGSKCSTSYQTSHRNFPWKLVPERYVVEHALWWQSRAHCVNFFL